MNRRSRTAVALATMLTIASIGAPASADHDQAAAEQAARDIQAAQDRADQAATDMFETAAQIEQLERDIAASEARVGEFDAQLSELDAALEEAAIQRYVGFGSTPIPLLAGFADVTDNVMAETYYQIAIDSTAIDINDAEQLRSDAADASDELADRRSAAETARERYTELQQQAEADMARLQQLEQVRQQDAAVEHEAQRLERERAAREAAELEARRAADERAAQEQATRAAQERQAREAGSTSGSDTNPERGPSRGGGSDATPPSPEPTPPARSNIICPIAGPNAFGDTWGDGRSGGRSHEGVDMMSPGGTPLVAVEAGTVQFKTNNLGGNTIWLTGASGTNYYYAHLSAWEGSSRSVSQGETIGYVGSTGNTTANHLHLQIHPGGGNPINPYPSVRSAC